MAWSKRIPFQVSVSGIIEIMGTSLYSRADTPIRELIQNAHDAIQRRRQRDLTFKGRIDIRQDPAAGTLSFHDDGIGLSAEEAERYLGTLGIGITGIVRRGQGDGLSGGDSESLIGMFGVGLFSAFMLAERVTVESRRADLAEGVRWEAGPATDIALESVERASPGTTVTLHLKPDMRYFATDVEMVEKAIREFADFLTVPIFLNDAQARVNVIQAAWFDPTPEREAIEEALEGYFDETPLDVLPLRSEQPASVAGALYITPERTPGFAGESRITATVRRMVISRKIQGLLPEWAPFLRGVLELNDCAPTASREDLVRDEAFDLVRDFLEEKLYEHLEWLADHDRTRFDAVIAWHRYTFAGAALTEDRLRALLQRTYRFPTSQGALTFDEILARSEADPLFETEADRVVWFNGDRRQERWANQLFAGQSAPCVHALRSFEESLLAALAADASSEGELVALRVASPSAPGFAAGILGISDLEDAPPEWQEFLTSTGAKVFCASFSEKQPVMAFLNERHELRRAFDELRKEGNIPAGFQRMIDSRLAEDAHQQNEVLLNRRHRLVARALEQKTTAPLASVLRLLVHQALHQAGATLDRSAQQQQADDLDWIAEALWGRK